MKVSELIAMNRMCPLTFKQTEGSAIVGVAGAPPSEAGVQAAGCARERCQWFVVEAEALEGGADGEIRGGNCAIALLAVAARNQTDAFILAAQEKLEGPSRRGGLRPVPSLPPQGAPPPKKGA